jgi:hypothetical protein
VIVAIHQPQYMPWCGYFHKIAKADLFVILDDVQFKKNEWQHRNRIRTPQGWQWLSVPNHYRFPQRINEVTVNNAVNWREKHMHAIMTSYGKAPWFKQYWKDFENFFAKDRTTMALLNSDSVLMLCRLFGITTPIEYSSAFCFEGASTERLVNICRHFKADNYLSGSGGRSYLDETLFARAGIKVSFQEFSSPRYPQHWAGSDAEFIQELSAVDLLFNCGGESLALLMGKTTTCA